MPARKQDSFYAPWFFAIIATLLFLGRQYFDDRSLGSAPAAAPRPASTVPRVPARRIDTTPSPAAVPPDAVAETYRVVAVIDGDTADVLVNGKPERLRFAGIDCPEKGQPFGKTAKSALSGRIAGKWIQVVVRETDRYGRSIADLYDSQGHINRWLVRQGLAWHYKAYSSDARLAEAEQAARREKRGLWSDPRHVAPWSWRKLSKTERDRLR